MKVGNLIRRTDSTCDDDDYCWCFFCHHQSSGIGLVLERLNEATVQHSAGYWAVMFEVGEWRLYGCEMETIGES